MKKILKKFFKSCFMIVLSLFLLGIGINYYVKMSSSHYIMNEDYQSLKNIDCILVLGAGIYGDQPTPMLKDRLDKAIELYQQHVSSKMIMSGDHSLASHDEVNVMKKYAIEHGVPSSDIFMDHAGLSTYESMYRAKEIFKVQNIVIVTQKYHMYRSVYIARNLGINAYGVNAQEIRYAGSLYREAREVLARNKDFIQSLLKLKPTYLGDTIEVSGNGDVTNDKEI